MLLLRLCGKSRMFSVEFFKCFSSKKANHLAVRGDYDNFGPKIQLAHRVVLLTWNKKVYMS